MSAQIVP